MSERDRLLDRLARTATPVRPAPDPRWQACLWLGLSTLYVVLATHLLGPIRPTAVDQLQTQPRFALEMLCGALAAASLALLAFKLAIPGAAGRGLRAVALGLGALWLAGLVFGLSSPALEPSMLGKRHHCYLEALLYALPPLLALLYWQRRNYALQPGTAAVLAGLAAGMLPALYMQIACMYQPAHILAFHVGPALLLAACAPLGLAAWRRWRP